MSKTKKPMPGPTERQVAEQVVEAARLYGIALERRNTGAALNPRGQMVRFGQPGDPDFEFTLPDGRRCALEVKRPGKTPTPAQWDRIHRVNAQNGVAFYIDDGAELARILPLLLAGARVVIDENGNQFVTDEVIEPRKERSGS